MRILSILSRGLLQELRDPLTLTLTLFTTPFFIFFYWMISSHSKPITIRIDLPKERLEKMDPMVRNELKTYIDKLKKEDSETSRFTLLEEENFPNKEGNSQLADITLTTNTHDADPSGKKIELSILFDGKNTEQSLIAYTLKSSLSDLFLERTMLFIRLEKKEEKQIRTPSNFDMFVPSFLVFSIIMIVFSTSMSLVSEIESGVFLRYRISHTPAFQFLLGMGGLQFLNSTLSISFAILVTKILGFDFHGKTFEVFFTCLLGSLSAIGMGMMIASFLNQTNQAFLSSSFVMFLLLLLSGIIFPKPNAIIEMGNLGQIDFIELLPTAQLKFILDSLLFENKSMGTLVENLVYLLLASIFFLMVGTYFFRQLFQKGSKT